MDFNTKKHKTEMRFETSEWNLYKQLSFTKRIDCVYKLFHFAQKEKIHIITNLWKLELNWSSKLRAMWKKKHPWCIFVFFHLPNNKRLQLSLLLFEWEITSFSTTTLLQREPFLTMFYTTNLSPLLVIK